MLLKKRRVQKFLLFLIFCLAALPALAADTEPPEMKRWVRTNDITDRDGDQRLRVKVVYYSNEYIEALVNSEAEKNLWTQDEMENYKYTLLKTLNLADSISFHLDLRVEGVPMYAAPFDKHISLMIGKNRYAPSDYDKRFNFKIQGDRDGVVSFPRYDPKTGRDLLERAKDIRLIFDKTVSRAISSRDDLVWIWDITKDKASSFAEEGRAMNRLEVDRLLKRLENLNKERSTLQQQLDELDTELNKVNSRIDELQSR